MSTLNNNSLFHVGEETKNQIHAAFNQTRKSIDSDLEIIREWLKHQPHLPETPSDAFIENCLLITKFSIESTKQRIDAYYTSRNVLPEFYENSHPKRPHMQQVFNTMTYLPMPILTKEFYRICIVKLLDTNPKHFVPLNYMASFLNVHEMRYVEDYSCGDILVMDMTGFSASHFAKYTPILAIKIGTLMKNVVDIRVKGVHFFNCPSFIDAVLTMVKTIMLPKLADRIYAHKKIEGLYKYIEQDLLPKEYGGSAPSIKELHDALWKSLMQYDERYKKCETMKVDESLRPEKLNYGEEWGLHGTFKKLQID